MSADVVPIRGITPSEQIALWRAGVGKRCPIQGHEKCFIVSIEMVLRGSPSTTWARCSCGRILGGGSR